VTRLTVIAYHAVGDCPPAEDPHRLWVSTRDFEWQMAYLGAKRQVVSLADAVAGRLEGTRPAVAITFDDAYRCVLTAAAPVLARHGFPATVFAPTQFIGDRNRWDPPTACALDVMSEDELRQAEQRGIAVESHGHGHVDLSAADVGTAREDVARSLDRLQAVLGRRPQFLAFPYRTGSPAAQQAVRQAGVHAAFTIDLPHGGQYAWGRVSITPHETPRVFALKTSGRYLALRYHPALAAGYEVLRRLRPR
jgi:peptidoglycan/xylan/chitin deacetylase (PgdA/CDA1 family)